MRISLIEAWKKENLAIQAETGFSILVDSDDEDSVREFLREQEARIQAEHELAVAREVCKVLDEISEIDNQKGSIYTGRKIDKIRARYSAKLEGERVEE